jgi:hypothetical protein
MRLPEFTPKGYSLNLERKGAKGLVCMIGPVNQTQGATLRITQANTAFTNIGYVPYHLPYALFNLFFELSPNGVIFAIRFIPFAIYVNDEDIKRFTQFWLEFHSQLQNTLLSLYQESGDYYLSRKEDLKAILVLKDRAVIIFGRYSEPEFTELTNVRDYLSRRYDAFLLKDMPKHPAMSLEEKVKLWSLASKF